MSGTITWTNMPWQYAVVDDFLSQRDFLSLQLKCAEFNKNVALPAAEENGDTKGHYRYKFQDDPLKDYDIMKWFIEFEIKRPYTELNSLVQIVKTCREAAYPIHEDAPHKIFSLVLYLSPEENIGTNIYNRHKEFVRAIDWKPNRALMFCPMDGITYHDYGSSTERFTLMYNLVNK